MENKQDSLNIPIKPPMIYFLSIVSGLIIQWLLPIKLLPTITVLLGLFLIPVALTLLIWGDRLFKAADTAVNHDIPPTTLITTGIYQYTRNPMYLGFTLLQIGIALALNNFWLLCTLLPTLVIMTYTVIHREEAFLEAEFGKAYLDYKAQVRRWL